MQGSSGRGLFAGLCLVSIWLTGCAAFHPLEGVPARYLPSEMKVGERTGKRTIDLSLLRQTPPSAHRVDSGDVLAIYVEGFVGRSSDPPPVFFPANNEVPPSFGLPHPVREDGTISLPQIGSINLRGLTIAQAEERVKLAYLKPRELIHPDNYRVQVSLQRPRQHRVLVIRQDSHNEPMAASGAGMFNLGMVKRGTGKVVSLPAYSNDVLNALTATDGLPGLDAENAVYIIRSRGPRMGGTLDQQWPTDFDPSLLLKQEARGTGAVVRGQSQTDEGAYSHENPLARSRPYGDPRLGEIAAGPLHEPLRLPKVDSSVVNANYVADSRRAIYQADWTDRGGWRDDPSRPLSLPDDSYHAESPSGIMPVAAWDTTQASGRYGNPFVTQANPGAVPPQAWPDPDAQARAIQLTASGAWSAQPGQYGSQAPPGHLPMQNTPHMQGQLPAQAGHPIQSTSENPSVLQRAIPDQSGAGMLPFGASPMSPGYNSNSAGSSEMVVQPRGMFEGNESPPFPPPPAGQWPPIETGHSGMNDLGLDGRHVIRIPIRLGPGETADIREEDIILRDGDIVFIESRDTEVFFTGGLLGGGQYTLPRDYDLDILQALSLATSQGGGGTSRNVGGVSALNNDVSISPSTVVVLRKLPDGGEVPIKVDLYRARTDLSERIVIQPGDFILLQYTPLEAIAAFVERHLLEGALFGLASQNLNQGN